MFRRHGLEYIWKRTHTLTFFSIYKYMLNSIFLLKLIKSNIYSESVMWLGLYVNNKVNNNLGHFFLLI